MTALGDTDASRSAAASVVTTTTTTTPTAAEKRRKKKNNLDFKRENESPPKEVGVVNSGDDGGVASNNGDTMKIVLPKRFNAAKERRETKNNSNNAKTGNKMTSAFNASDAKPIADNRREGSLQQRSGQFGESSSQQQQQQQQQHSSSSFSSFFGQQLFNQAHLANSFSYSFTQADQDSFHSHSLTRSQHAPLQQIQEQQQQQQQQWSYPPASNMHQQQPQHSSQLSSFNLPSALNNIVANPSSKSSQTHPHVYTNHNTSHSNNNNVGNAHAAFVGYNANGNEYPVGGGGILPMDGIFSGRFYSNYEAEKKPPSDVNVAKASRGSKKNNHNWTHDSVDKSRTECLDNWFKACFKRRAINTTW